MRKKCNEVGRNVEKGTVNVILEKAHLLMKL